MFEYLEKILEASFKREFEQDENVVRSLPFFATALGVIVAIFSQIITRMPAPETGAAGIVNIMLAGAAGAFTWVLWCLFQIVRVREYKVPPDEQKLVAWAEALRAYYAKQGKTPAQAEKAATSDLRNRMIAAYAESAVHNREVNRSKFKHRTIGLTWLVILMALATLAVGVIFVEKRWISNLHHRETGHVEDTGPPSADARAVTPTGQTSGEHIQQTTAAADANRGTGREVSVRSGSQGLKR